MDSWEIVVEVDELMIPDPTFVVVGPVRSDKTTEPGVACVEALVASE